MSEVEAVSAELADPMTTAENGRGVVDADGAKTTLGAENAAPEAQGAGNEAGEPEPADALAETELAPDEPEVTELAPEESEVIELAPDEPEVIEPDLAEVPAETELAPEEPAVTDLQDAPEQEDGEDEALGFEMPAAMSQMTFVDVVLVLPSTHPVLVLQEAGYPYRELRIPIGGPEGIAIGYASRQLATPRPLTHELMTRLIEGFGLTLEVVRITGLAGGTYMAEIVVSGPTGQRTFDCRPSDAVALALRQAIRVPIVADPDVLDRAGGAAAGQN